MSLINQMLRDLDARQVNADETNGTDRQKDPVKAVERGAVYKSKRLLVSFFVLSLFSAFYLLWPGQMAKTTIIANSAIVPVDSLKNSQAKIAQEEPAEATPSAIPISNSTHVAKEPIPAPVLLDQVEIKPQLTSIERHSLPTSVNDKTEATVIPTLDVPHKNVLKNPPDQVFNQQSETSLAPVTDIPNSAESSRVASLNFPEIELIPEIMLPERVNEVALSQVKEAVFSNVKVKQVSKKSPAADARRLYEKGLSLIEGGRLTEAEQVLQDVVARAPGHLDARRMLAMLYIQAERRPETVSLLDKGLAIKPGHLPFIALRARLHADAGELMQARVLLEQRPVGETVNLEALELLASIYQQTSQYKKASEIYHRINKLHPDIARVWAGLAICQDALGDARSALVSYRNALNLKNLAPAVISYVQQRIAILEVER